MSSLVRRPSPYIRLNPMLSGPLAASKAFQLLVSLKKKKKIFSQPLEVTQHLHTVYLKDVAWAGSEPLQLGPVVAAQQTRNWPIYTEICIYVVLIVLGTNYMPSFGRLLPSGTELIPLFPYLRAGLLKGRGGGNVGIRPGNRALVSDHRPTGFLT